RSGRTGRSRKPLSLLRGTEGSNPSLSANRPFLAVSTRLNNSRRARPSAALASSPCLPPYRTISLTMGERIGEGDRAFPILTPSGRGEDDGTDGQTFSGRSREGEGTGGAA